MTKEELEKEADEYAERHAFRIPYDGSNNFYDDKDYECSKEGYIAGAKAHLFQWHDLRKNPDDLPKDSSVLYEVLNQNGTRVYYDDVLKKWYIYNGSIVQAQTPIAWCEIPKFKE